MCCLFSHGEESASHTGTHKIYFDLKTRTIAMDKAAINRQQQKMSCQATNAELGMYRVSGQLLFFSGSPAAPRISKARRLQQPFVFQGFGGSPNDAEPSQMRTILAMGRELKFQILSAPNPAQ